HGTGFDAFYGFVAGFLLAPGRAGRFLGVLGGGVVLGFSLPPISVKASSALKGNSRADCCDSTPGAFSVISTRRFCARTMVFRFLMVRLRSSGVRLGLLSTNCFTSAAVSWVCLPKARV